MSNIKYLILSIGVMLYSCVSTEIQPPTTSGFFDLNNFIEKEIADKSDAISTFRKTVTLDGVTETQELSSFNLVEELKVFSDANINKTAWLDRYAVDSIFSKAKVLEKIKYQALKEDLRTQELSIIFNSEKVDTIYIVQKSNNLLASAAQNLTYIPAYGYKIENLQEITSLDPHKLSVDVMFVR